MDELIDETGRDEWFITLDIDDVGGVGKVGKCLGEAICAGEVGCGCHDGFSAEVCNCFVDALIIGGDDDFVEGGGVFATIPDVLDEGFSGDEVERFSGKPRGAPTCGQDADSAGLVGVVGVFGHTLQ